MVNTNKLITLFELMGGDNIEKSWYKVGHMTTPELFLKLDILRLNNIYKCMGYGKFFEEGDYYLLRDNIVFNESNSFDKLVRIFVPKEGKAPTLLGEMLRALSYIKTKLCFGSSVNELDSSLLFLYNTTCNIVTDKYFSSMFNTVMNHEIIPKDKLSISNFLIYIKENPDKLNYYLDYLEKSLIKIMTSNLCYDFLKREENLHLNDNEVPLTMLKCMLRLYSQENEDDSRNYNLSI